MTNARVESPGPTEATIASGGAEATVELATPPMTTLAIRAEQALLGEVLHLAAAGRPQPMAQAAAVRPGDFYRPYHRQVFTACLRLAEHGQRPDPQAVLAELSADPDLPQHLASDGVRLIELMEAATGTGTLPAAAQLVIEAALRRRITEWSIRLRQISEGDGLETEVAVGAVGTLLGEVTQWRARFGSPMNRPSRPGPAVIAPPLRVPAEQTDAVPELEVALLASLVTYPGQVTEIAAWLAPEYLTGAWTRHLYQRLLSAHRRERRIDPLSLARVAAHLNGPASAHLVTRLRQGLPWGHHLARQIHLRAAQILTRQTSRRLETLSGDLELRPRQVLEQAASTVMELGHHLAGTQHHGRTKPRIAAARADSASQKVPSAVNLGLAIPEVA